MAKALIKSGELDSCVEITDEDDAICQMLIITYEIINGQNFQIQTTRGVNNALGHAAEDYRKVDISGTPAPEAKSKETKAPKVESKKETKSVKDQKSNKKRKKRRF